MSMRVWFSAVSRWLGFRSENFSEQIPQLQQWRALGINSETVSRDQAMTIHGVVRARDAICSISTLPLITRNAKDELQDNPLLRQFDKGRTNVVHLSRTFEDLYFDEISWWYVTARDSSDFPTFVEHVGKDRVSEDEKKGIRYLDGKEVPWDDLIKFESPKSGLLKNGGRLLRRALNLDKTAALYADNPRPLDYFTVEEGADGTALDREAAEAEIDHWNERRKVSATALVIGLKYNQVDTPTPQELQLIEGQKQASVEVANFTGMDTEDLGVSTTSRTYQNAVDRRRDRINDLLSLYMRAITDRLSMPDITRQGHRVEFDLTDYMKANPTERVAYYSALWAMKSITRDEIRKAEGLEPLSAEQLMQIEAQHVVQATIQPRQIGAGDGAS
jgi:portal protein